MRAHHAVLSAAGEPVAAKPKDGEGEGGGAVVRSPQEEVGT